MLEVLVRRSRRVEEYIPDVLEIRPERPDDAESIREVNDLAFGRPQEGRLVEALRANEGVLLSLVAVRDSRLVGHILYSPVHIGSVVGVGLGPMAVLPECQRQGIGGELIRAGIQRIADAGHPFVVVLGYPEFYGRFGFRPASTRGIRCAWDVPDAAFMVLVLDERRMLSVSGLADYRHEFSTVS
jgi:putative acetyltransferase